MHAALYQSACSQLQLACILSASLPNTRPIIARSQNTHLHLLTKEKLAVGGLHTLWEPDSSVLFQGVLESTTNNNHVKPTPSALNPIRGISYSSQEVQAVLGLKCTVTATMKLINCWLGQYRNVTLWNWSVTLIEVWTVENTARQYHKNTWHHCLCSVIPSRCNGPKPGEGLCA